MGYNSSGSSEKVVSSLSNQQQAIANQFYRVLAGKGSKKGFENSPMTQGIDPYTGDFIADLVPEQQQVRDQLGNYYGGITPSLQNNAYNSLLQGENSYSPNTSYTDLFGNERNYSQASFDLSPEATENYIKNSVATPLMREWTDTVMPEIESAFAGANNAFSTRKAEALSDSLSDMNMQIASEASKAAYQNQQLQAQLNEAAANRGLQVEQLISSLSEGAAGRQLAATQQVDPALTNLAAYQGLSNQYQEMEQAKTQAEYDEWLRTQSYNNPWLQLALSYTGQAQTGTVGSSSGWGFDLSGAVQGFASTAARAAAAGG